MPHLRNTLAIYEKLGAKNVFGGIQVSKNDVFLRKRVCIWRRCFRVQ